MIKCLIVEDELPAQKILISFIEDSPQLELKACCNNALDAMGLLQKEVIDLIFLDIHLPKLSGLNFLRSIKNPPKVIITSAYPEYALEGFELDVMDYLLKPFSFERFIKAIQKFPAPGIISDVTSDNVSTTSKNHIFIKMDKSFQKIYLKDILFIESDKDFVKIHTTEKFFMELKSLKSYESELPENFVRIHKSFIINTDKLTLLEGNRVKVDDHLLPVGRSFKESLVKKLNL